MNRPRASIQQILVVVALVGADLAVYRFATGSEPFGWNLLLLTALAPAFLALNVAAFAALFVRGRPRAFWLGYLLFGVAAESSLILAFNDPPSQTTVISGDGATEHRSYPGGAMARAWNLYFEWAHDGLHRLGFDYDPVRTVWKSTMFDAVVILLPRLLVACVGGWATWRVSGRRAEGDPIGPSDDHGLESAPPDLRSTVQGARPTRQGPPEDMGMESARP